MYVLGRALLDSEIPSLNFIYSNHSSKNAVRQYLVGSFIGAIPSQKVTEGFKGQLGANGNRADSVMAQAGLTVSGTSQADAKAGHSDPMVSFRWSQSSTDKSYSGDNRLVVPKSSYRRHSSAPRCRLNLSWGWRRSQGYGCSPFKKLRELGSNRSGIKEIDFRTV